MEDPDAVVVPTVVPRSFREGNLRAYRAVRRAASWTTPLFDNCCEPVSL